MLFTSVCAFLTITYNSNCYINYPKGRSLTTKDEKVPRVKRPMRFRHLLFEILALRVLLGDHDIISDDISGLLEAPAQGQI